MLVYVMLVVDKWIRDGGYGLVLVYSRKWEFLLEVYSELILGLVVKVLVFVLG